MTARTPGAHQVDSARQIAARAARAERKAAAASRQAQAAARDLAALHAATEARFGMSIPCDPFLLDVLAMIAVRPGGVWHWTGQRNNRGIATVRVGLGERSVVRYLALAFGVIGPDDNGVLYPTAGRDDLNPWRRVLRVSARPVGRTSGPWPKTEEAA